MLGGLDLAPLGILFYAHLLVAIVLQGVSPYVQRCAIVAFAIHLTGTWLLLSYRITCVPCLATAASALQLLVVVSLQNGRRLHKPALLLAAFTVSFVGVMSVVGSPLEVFDSRLILKSLIAQERDRTARRVASVSETVRLVVFERAGCLLCAKLRRELIPPLVRDYSSKIEVEFRRAPPNLPTPTVVVVGKSVGGSVGLPDAEELRRMVKAARGR